MVSFIDVGLLVFFAALSGLLAVRFSIPPVLALLTTGAIIGPHALRLISENDIVALFAEIGAVLLLFTIGAEFSIAKLKQFGAKALSIGLIKLSIVFAVSFQLAQLLGLDSLSSLYMAAILAITSTALTVKILEQRGLAHRREVPLLVAALVIEDIFAIFALAYFSAANNAHLTTLGLATSILVALATLGIAYFVVLAGLNRMLAWLTDRRTQETMLFLGFALAIGFSYLAQALGLSTSVGAFLAGSLVASLPKGKVLEEALSPFTLALSSIFFLAIGLAVNLNTVFNNGLLLIVFVVAGIMLKLAATGVSTYLNGFDSKSAAFAAVAMVPTGEFSLVIASVAVEAGSPVDLIGLTSTLVFVSTVFTTVLIQRYSDVQSVATRWMPMRVQQAGRQAAMQLEAVSGAFGHMPLAVREQVQRAKTNVAWTSVVLGAALVALVFVGSQQWRLEGIVLPASLLVLAVGTLLVLPFLRQLGGQAGSVFAYVSQAVRRQADAAQWFGFLALSAGLLLVPFVFPIFGPDQWLLNLALTAGVLVAIAYLWTLRAPRRPGQSWPFVHRRGL